MRANPRSYVTPVKLDMFTAVHVKPGTHVFLLCLRISSDVLSTPFFVDPALLDPALLDPAGRIHIHCLHSLFSCEVFCMQ